MRDILTGNIQYRQSFFGKLILQVEEMPGPGTDMPKHFRYWRDAKVKDLTEIRGNLGCQDQRSHSTQAAVQVIQMRVGLLEKLIP